MLRDCVCCMPTGSAHRESPTRAVGFAMVLKALLTTHTTHPKDAQKHLGTSSRAGVLSWQVRGRADEDPAGSFRGGPMPSLALSPSIQPRGSLSTMAAEGDSPGQNSTMPNLARGVIFLWQGLESGVIFFVIDSCNCKSIELIGALAGFVLW